MDKQEMGREFISIGFRPSLSLSLHPLPPAPNSSPTPSGPKLFTGRNLSFHDLRRAVSSVSSFHDLHHPVADASETSPFGSLSPAEFYSRHNVAHSTSSFLNPENLRIFTQTWTPLPPAPTISTVCVVHGFTGESSWFVQLTSVLLAEHGFAVCALDHVGHGFSDGLHSHIPDIRPVVRDCVSVFSSFCTNFSSSLPSFLYSESLGGAIALLIHVEPSLPWNGIVLNGAMCGISAKFKPPWSLEHLLSLAAAAVPTWQVVGFERGEGEVGPTFLGLGRGFWRRGRSRGGGRGGRRGGGGGGGISSMGRGRGGGGGPTSGRVSP